jgi:hypothetical protein
MDLKRLKGYLDSFAESLKNSDKKLLHFRLKGLVSAFPFNEYEYILMFLLDKNIIRFKEYENLRNDYVSSNRYLELYGIAPRIFGEIWVHQHLMDIDDRFKKPNRSLDPRYEGEYDLWVEGVKVEVKASRAINTKISGKLESKGLRHGEVPFWMNFQQIKLDISDVFIFIGVWVDRICYWVMSGNEIKNHPVLSHQHRGGVEYQIGFRENNLKQFDKYLVKPTALVTAILKKAQRKY